MQTRFTRGRGQEANGSGLGLSIVASAMERLGGSIAFFKGPERGQTVTLTLNF